LSATKQSLRIIGGEYRGRRLEFIQSEGLRPTTDRVRETLFNWLQPVIQGARCLDMFAGSGLLGMEAASRGAGEVVFIEQQADVAERIASNIKQLGAASTRLIQANAIDALPDLQQPFDVVFVDPPFGTDLLATACRQLQEYQLVKPAGRVYLESERQIEVEELPAGWQLIRSKKAGHVYYYLATIEHSS
jgi:16S rRNA (guanine966-N2)-methyltransferase